MQCPYCGATDLRVMDSRPSGAGIRRRRECSDCTGRFTTYEEIASPAIKVRKRDSRTIEEFDRSKLRRVMGRLCKGLVIPVDKQDAVVRSLEAELTEANLSVIDSWEIADRLLGKLRDLDDLAAERLASNYVGPSGQLNVAPPNAAPQLELPSIEEVTEAKNPPEPAKAKRAPTKSKRRKDQ